jgi:hypothetical protein
MSGAQNQRDPDGSETVLRTSSATTIGWTTVVAGALVALLIVVQVPPGAAVAMLGLPLLIATVGWACYLRPRVLLAGWGLRVVNIVRTHDVPFARIESIDQRLGVTLTTVFGSRIGVWSLPDAGRRVRRPGMFGRAAEPHVPDEAVGQDAQPEAGRQGFHRGIVEPHTAPPVQQLLDARARWLQSEDGPAGPSEITTRTHPWPIVLCGVALLWALWGLSVTATF